MKQKIFTLFTVLFFTHLSYCQETNNDRDRVLSAKEIVFYGYDFSHFKLADAKRMDQDIRKFTFMWIGLCEESITKKKLQNKLNKDNVIWNFEPTLNINKKLNSEDLVTPATYTFMKDSLQSFINAYSITEKEGIGFVINIECFDNAHKKVFAYYTFFDIATKKILMTDYISSWNGNSYNRVLDWGDALVVNIKKYLSVYKDK